MIGKLFRHAAKNCDFLACTECIMHLQPAHVAQVYDTTPSIQDLCSIDGSSIIIAIFPPTYIRLK